MPEFQNTLLEVINHILNQHPALAPSIETLAASVQGKGYGTVTIEQEVKALHELINANAQPNLAIDIGGNIGDYTAELRRMNQSLEIHTFEPSPINVSKLQSRFQGDGLVKIVPFALSDEAGSATLFSNIPGSGLGSLTQRRLQHHNIAFESKESVSTIRFEDYWIAELKSRPIDLVKIDVEGHELNVLKGFGSALPVTKVIQFEFGGTDIDTRTFFQDFWYFFRDARFSLYRLSPFGPQQITSYAENDECFRFTLFAAVNQR